MSRSSAHQLKSRSAANGHGALTASVWSIVEARKPPDRTWMAKRNPTRAIIAVVFPLPAFNPTDSEVPYYLHPIPTSAAQQAL
jgi:hypothetical protein